MKKALIFDIEHSSFVDGPGIRTTVFFKGCNLKCKWCHNPESQNKNEQILFYKDKCTGCQKCKSVCPYALEKCDFCGKCALFCPNDAREICGKEYTALEVLNEILKDKEYYGSTGGATFTPMISSYADDVNQEYKRHAIERFIRPEEIAELAFYLMSDYGEIVCGHTVIADGGDNSATL